LSSNCTSNESYNLSLFDAPIFMFSISIFLTSVLKAKFIFRIVCIIGIFADMCEIEIGRHIISLVVDHRPAVEKSNPFLLGLAIGPVDTLLELLAVPSCIEVVAVLVQAVKALVVFSRISTFLY